MGSIPSPVTIKSSRVSRRMRIEEENRTKISLKVYGLEFMNDGKKLGAPSEDHVTQEVMTNELGEFSFVMPHAGWWGFAALIDDDEKMSKDGKEYPVELGGVIWIKADNYKK